MRTASALPRPFSDHAFSTAHARDAGVGKGRLRGPDLEAPFRGVRRVRPSPPTVDRSTADGPSLRAERATTGATAGSAERRRRERFLADCRALATVLRPNEVFCGVTAAELWDAPLAAPFRGGVLHVGVLRPGRARRASGTAGHTLAPDTDISTRRYGLPVTDAASTWLALAAVLPLPELVVVGDHLLHRPVFEDRDAPGRPYLTADTLAARVERHSARGAATAREALGLLVTGAESRPESLLRLLLGRFGLPEPEVNTTIADARGRVGRFDLVYREWKVAVEYDGDQHRTDDRQYELDMTRFERATEAGWSVIRVRKHGLFRAAPATAARVEDALRRAGWRPPRATRGR